VYFVQGLIGPESQFAIAGSTLKVWCFVQHGATTSSGKSTADSTALASTQSERWLRLVIGSSRRRSVTTDLKMVIAATVNPTSAGIWIRD
jgi:hypothetical protein